MTLPVQRMINSICSKQLSLITKRTIHQEAKHPTIDALGQIKRRRHEYLGHILRLDPSRLLHRFIAEIPSLHKQGSLTSEVPFRTMDDMKVAAEDRDAWRKLLTTNERTDVGESRASLGTARSRQQGIRNTNNQSARFCVMCLRNGYRQPSTSEQFSLQEVEDRKSCERNLPYILAFLALFKI